MQATKEALLARLRGEKADFIPEIWREFIKPTEKRYAERIHEYGMIYMHHSCGFIQQIIPDLVEIGVDAINPMMVKNDIDYVMDHFGDKITVVGGLDNQFMERPGTTEEEIRVEVRSKMDRYVNRGRYIPFIHSQFGTGVRNLCG